MHTSRILATVLTLLALTGCVSARGLVQRDPAPKPAGPLTLALVLDSAPAKGRDCGKDRLAPPDQDPDAKGFAVACGEKDGERVAYRVKTTNLVTVRLESVQVQKLRPSDPWEVNLRFAPKSADAIARLTKRAADSDQQLAMISDGTVLYAATVSEPIPGRFFAIYGDFSKDEAEDVAEKFGG